MKNCRSCPEIDFENQGVDLGCLPCAGEIRNAVHEGAFWECHSRPNKVCQCAVREAKKHSIDVPDEPTVGETFGEAPDCWKNPQEKV